MRSLHSTHRSIKTLELLNHGIISALPGYAFCYSATGVMNDLSSPLGFDFFGGLLPCFGGLGGSPRVCWQRLEASMRAKPLGWGRAIRARR